MEWELLSIIILAATSVGPLSQVRENVNINQAINSVKDSMDSVGPNRCHNVAAAILRQTFNLSFIDRYLGPQSNSNEAQQAISTVLHIARDVCLYHEKIDCLKIFSNCLHSLTPYSIQVVPTVYLTKMLLSEPKDPKVSDAIARTLDAFTVLRDFDSYVYKDEIRNAFMVYHDTRDPFRCRNIAEHLIKLRVPRALSGNSIRRMLIFARESAIHSGNIEQIQFFVKCLLERGIGSLSPKLYKHLIEGIPELDEASSSRSQQDEPVENANENENENETVANENENVNVPNE